MTRLGTIYGGSFGRKIKTVTLRWVRRSYGYFGGRSVLYEWTGKT